jgi:hypothetical protein
MARFRHFPFLTIHSRTVKRAKPKEGGARRKQRSRTAFPAPDKETGADENGTPSTGRPSFTVLRRRAHCLKINLAEKGSLPQN